MTGYTARDVARMLDLSVGQIRSYARAGFLAPRRGQRGEYRFSFQDLVVLRAAKGLIEARIPPRKIKSALTRLREQLPARRPLTAVQIAAAGEQIVVRDGRAIWNPESGQTHLDFEVSELAEKVTPLARRAAREAIRSEDELEAEDWFELGCDLEAGATEEARDSYRRALEVDPVHADAHVNLGRLLHEAGRLRSAEAHYRLALAARSGDSTAAFDLGVCLEDEGRDEEAIQAYQKAIASDPRCADAHYNAARLCEKLGDRQSALRHWKAYRKLTQGH